MSAKSDTTNDDHIGVDVPSELKKQVRMEAAKDNVNLSQKVREILLDAVED